MHDGWMTTAALLARTRIPGKRPDAVLKRLRLEGILARPVRGKSLGRARGVVWWYPPGSDTRVSRVLELRRHGCRTFRELRWQLWFEGATDVWERLQVDLLAAYPHGIQAELERLATLDEDEVDDAIASEAAYLADHWSGRPLPTGEPTRRISAADQETLAHVAIAAAVPGHKVSLDAPLDQVTGGTTIRHTVDNVWGSRSGASLDELVESGAIDPERWWEALRKATPLEAAQVASLLRRTFNQRLLRRDRRLFEEEWADRALAVGGFLYSLKSLGRMSQT